MGNASADCAFQRESSSRSSGASSELEKWIATDRRQGLQIQHRTGQGEGIGGAPQRRDAIDREDAPAMPICAIICHERHGYANDQRDRLRDTRQNLLAFERRRDRASGFIQRTRLLRRLFGLVVQARVIQRDRRARRQTPDKFDVVLLEVIDPLAFQRQHAEQL
jgi:hypothetical protein